jgi:hypothetical protein
MSNASLLSQLLAPGAEDGLISAEGAPVSAGITLYDSIGELPYSNNTAGDQAFVTGTNRLYIWVGAGWYNVALINRAPTISSVQDSDGNTSPFDLAIDGTATTITITAADSDGDPITYSAVADSDFNGLATITGSGNEFTITPFSQDSATTTAGTITFKATDGINITSSINTFTLSFLSELWDETLLSIGTSSTNGLDNSTFIDRSTNAHTVTTSGTPVQTAFHPYLDYYSANFTADIMSIPTSPEFNVGNGDFTFETWMNSSTSGGTFFDFGGNQNVTYNGFRFGWQSSGILDLVINQQSNSASGEFRLLGSTPINDGNWNHIRVTRTGTTIRFFINGVLDASATTSVTGYQASSPWMIGCALSSGSPSGSMTGYLFNYRLVKGTSLNTTDDSFDPPTENLTAIPGTSLLLFNDKKFIDKSSSSHSLTFYSNSPAISAFNPFGQGSEYAVGENKGSVFMDGSSAMTLAHSTDFELGTSDFTISGWIYPSENTSRFISTEHNYGSLASHYFYLNSSGYLNGVWYVGNSGTQLVSDSIVTKNGWHHVAMGRTGTTIFLALDGVVKTGTLSGTIDNPNVVLNIGQQSNGSQRFSGYISDLRFDKGTVQYESTYTVPSTPVTTSVTSGYYLPMDNAGIFDKTGNNALTLTASTTTSTTQTKFAGTSVYSGFSNYIGCNVDISGVQWTIEGWIYMVDTQIYNVFVETRSGSSSIGSTNFVWEGGTYNDASGKSRVYIGGSALANYVQSASAYPVGQWTHVAVTRDENNLVRLFTNGILDDSKTITNNCTAPINKIAGEFADSYNMNCYLENFQILKGVAKYTTNFTPPTKTQGRTYQATSQ